MNKIRPSAKLSLRFAQSNWALRVQMSPSALELNKFLILTFMVYTVLMQTLNGLCGQTLPFRSTILAFNDNYNGLCE